MSIEARFNKIKFISDKLEVFLKTDDWMSKLKKNDLQGKNGLSYTIADIDCFIKIIPLEKGALEAQHSLKFSSWRELTALRWVNQLVKGKISPNFFTLLTFRVIEDCSQHFKKEKGCVVLFLEKADGTLYDWIKVAAERKENITSDIWMSVFFQIFSAIYAVQHKFGLIHRDLHWKNILYQKIDTQGYWLYYLKKIPYYVPSYGYSFGICDFGKSLRRQDAFLSGDTTRRYSGKSSHIFIQGDDEKWRDWYIYQSQKLVEDLHRISHLPRWISNEHFGDVMPDDIKDMLHKLQKDWTTDNSFLPGEIIMLSMGTYLDPRIGQIYTGTTDAEFKHFTVGDLVVYKDHLVMIAVIYNTSCQLIISKFKMEKVDINKIKKPLVLPKIPIENIIGIFHLD